jgi:hypothetical protein
LTSPPPPSFLIESVILSSEIEKSFMKKEREWKILMIRKTVGEGVKVGSQPTK